MIAPFLALLLASAQAPPSESVTIAEMECFAMVQRGSVVETSRLPDFHVIERPGREGPFAAPELPPGTSAIMCPRSTIVPAPNDWKVLRAGYPLFLSESRVPPENRRVGVLELSQGQFRYRFVRGEMRQGEQATIQARLDLFQDLAQR